MVTYKTMPNIIKAVKRHTTPEQFIGLDLMEVFDLVFDYLVDYDLNLVDGFLHLNERQLDMVLFAFYTE